MIKVWQMNSGGVSHTSSDSKIHKSPPRKSSAPWINKRDQLQCDLIAAIQVWWLDKKRFDLGTLMGRPTQLNIYPHFIFIIFINKHLALSLSLSQLRHAFLDTSRWNLQSRDPHWSLPNQSGSYGLQWRSGWLWRRILQQHIFCFLLFRDPLIWPNQFYCEWSKKKLPWRKHQKATWHGLPMGDGGLQVSPKTTNAQLFVLRSPAFFPFSSISCLVMSTPQRFCSKSPLGWGQNGSNRGGTT